MQTIAEFIRGGYWYGYTIPVLFGSVRLLITVTQCLCMGLVDTCYASTICNQILLHMQTVLLRRGSSSRQARGRINRCLVIVPLSVASQSTRLLVCNLFWCLHSRTALVFRLQGLNLTSLINALHAVLSCASSNHLARQTFGWSVVRLSAGNPSFILVSGDTVATALFISPPLPRLCIIACPHVRCCPPRIRGCRIHASAILWHSRW